MRLHFLLKIVTAQKVACVTSENLPDHGFTIKSIELAMRKPAELPILPKCIEKKVQSA